MPDFLDDKEKDKNGVNSGSINESTQTGLDTGSLFRPRQIGLTSSFGAYGVRTGSRVLEEPGQSLYIEPDKPELRELKEREKDGREIEKLNKEERNATFAQLNDKEKGLKGADRRHYNKAEHRRNKVSRQIKAADEKVNKIKAKAADEFSEPAVFNKLTVSTNGSGTLDTMEDFRTWWNEVSQSLPPMPSHNDREAMNKWQDEVQQFKEDKGYYEKLAWVRTNRKLEQELTNQNNLYNEFNSYNTKINQLTEKATGKSPETRSGELAEKEKQLLGTRYDEKNRKLKPFNYQENKNAVAPEQFNASSKAKELISKGVAEKVYEKRQKVTELRNKTDLKPKDKAKVEAWGEDITKTETTSKTLFGEHTPKPQVSKLSEREIARALAKKYIADDASALAPLTTEDKALIIKYLLEGDMPELDKRLLIQFMREYVSTDELFLIFTKEKTSEGHIDPELYMNKMKELNYIKKLEAGNDTEKKLLGHSLKSERAPFRKKKKEIKTLKREGESHAREGLKQVDEDFAQAVSQSQAFQDYMAGKIDAEQFFGPEYEKIKQSIHYYERKSAIRAAKREEMREARYEMKTTSRYGFIRDHNYNQHLLDVIGVIKDSEDGIKKYKDRKEAGDTGLDEYIEKILQTEKNLQNSHKEPDDLSFMGSRRQFVEEYFSNKELTISSDLFMDPFNKAYIEGRKASKNIKAGANEDDELWNYYQAMYGNSPDDAVNILGQSFDNKGDFITWLNNPATGSKSKIFKELYAKVDPAFAKPGELEVNDPLSGVMDWTLKQGKDFGKAFGNREVTPFLSHASQSFDRLEKPLMYGATALGILEIIREQAIEHQDWRTYFTLLNAYLNQDFKLWEDTLPPGLDLDGNYSREHQLLLSLKNTESMKKLIRDSALNKNYANTLSSGLDPNKVNPQFYASLIYNYKFNRSGLNEKDPSSSGALSVGLNYHRYFGMNAGQQETTLFKYNHLVNNFGTYDKDFSMASLKNLSVNNFVDFDKLNQDMTDMKQTLPHDLSNVGLSTSYKHNWNRPSVNQQSSLGGGIGLNYVQGFGQKKIDGTLYNNQDLMFLYASLGGTYNRSNFLGTGGRLESSFDFTGKTVLNRDKLDDTYAEKGIPADTAALNMKIRYMLNRWSIDTGVNLDFTGNTDVLFRAELAKQFDWNSGTVTISLGVENFHGLDPKKTFMVYSGGAIFTIGKKR